MTYEKFSDIDIRLEEMIVLEQYGFSDMKELDEAVSKKPNTKSSPKKLSSTKKPLDKKDVKDKLLMAKEKSKGIFAEVKKLVSSLYHMKDEDFVNGAFVPTLTRIIARGTIVAGIFAVGGIVPGAIAFCTNAVIKKNVDIKTRKRLLDYYNDKMEYINTKIEQASSPEKKYDLVKMRTSIKNSQLKLTAHIKKEEMAKEDI